MISIIVSHDRSWVVDESGERFGIGDADDIPCFIDFLNFAIDQRESVVTHEQFADFRRDKKRAAGEPPTTHEELDHPPGVGIPEGSTPPPAPPPPDKEEQHLTKEVAAKEEKSNLMYPPDDESKAEKAYKPLSDEEKAKVIEELKSASKGKKGGKKK